MTADQIKSLPRGKAFGSVVTDLRWKLAELDGNKLHRWRSMDKAARQILALAWVERGDPPETRSPPVFEGFARLLAKDHPPHMASLAEIADAYTAIGAEAPAQIVQEAERMAPAMPEDPSEQSAYFSDLNQRMRVAATSIDVSRLLDDFVRANAEALAVAQVE